MSSGTPPHIVLRPPGRDLSLLVAIGAVQAAALVASVLLLRRLVDDLTDGSGTASDALAVAYVFCAVGVFRAVARGLEYTVAERVGYRMVARLRMILHAHLLDLPARSVTRSSQGAVLLRFTGDLSTFRTWISRGLSRGVMSSVTLVGGIAVLMVIDWVIGLAVVGVLLTAAAGSAIGGYHVRRATRAVRWRRSLLTSNVAEQIRSLAVVQAFGRAGGESDRLSTQNEDLLGALGRAADARGHLRFLAALAGNVAVGVVAIVGVLELDRGRVTIGGIVAAMTAARFLTTPVLTLGRSHEYWQAAQVSRRKLDDFLARPPRVVDDRSLPPLRVRRGEIEIRGLEVDGALHGVDLSASPGEILAITGPNGAGKSTLLSVLARIATPSAGEVLIDGQNIAHHSTRSTVRNVGIVSPDLPLMRGTIRRNITYRRRRASEEMVNEVIASCRLDEVIDSLDQGLSTWVVEGGANLSVGQRQRVMLARAILGRPRILLLDEPVANLDHETRTVFREVIARYGGTVVLVTHDPDDLAISDRVCSIDNGRVTAITPVEQMPLELDLEPALPRQLTW